MMWKILMAQKREDIYDSLKNRKLFPEEGKGCCKGYGGIGELPYTNQHIHNECNTRLKNLATLGNVQEI